MTKSEIFSQYNKARAAAKNGKLDPNRTNRALGVLMSKSTRPYTTTTKSCNCPDRVRNTTTACKHMIAKMIEVRVAQAHTSTTTTSTPVTTTASDISSPWMETSNGGYMIAEIKQGRGGYFIHEFEYLEVGKEWASTEHHGILTRPSKAWGKKLGSQRHI